MPVNQDVPGAANPYAPRTAVADVAFTIAAETGGNTKQVTAQFKDYLGANLAHRANVRGYLSDDADGDSVVATAPSGAVAAVASSGLVADFAATKKAFWFTTTAAGLLAFTIIEAGAKTLYVVIVLPDGKLKVSGAVVFA